MKVYDNVCDLIGNTPLVRLNNIEEYLQINNRIYAKIEKFNPGGSSKDRPAYQIIKEAIEKEKIDKNQRDYILREQMDYIRNELGDKDEDSELAQFSQALEKLKADKEIKDKIKKEISRYKTIMGASSESAVQRGYIETLLELPWNKVSKDTIDMDKAEEVLNRDHYGLEKVKERILEYLAVRALTSKGEAPILCLVGPPGTGKTSIAKSIADALNKKYVRICLGGVRDEAEIRGHRRTYIGAMPGRIANGLRQAGRRPEAGRRRQSAYAVG